ncbi:MAG: hypothetical protein U9P44_02505, partial [archaeon]|nr:hypothetical protein [archaeon]
RKRAIFILTNFLASCGWSFRDIEEELLAWNKRNPDPIKTVYIKTQLNYAVSREKMILPPNCKTAGYYKDLKVCVPDGFCPKIQNPVAYAFKKSGAFKKGREEKKGNKKKKDLKKGKG